MSSLLLLLFMSLGANDTAPSVGELEGPQQIVESWDLTRPAFGSMQWPLPDGPLGDANFHASREKVDSPKHFLVGLRWKQRARTDGILELDIEEGWFAGGRILAWHVPGGLMVEQLVFGSGVPVASGERFKVARPQR